MKQYIICTECKKPTPKDEVVYAFEENDVFNTPPTYEDTESYAICKSCAEQCKYCKKWWFHMELHDCGDCEAKICADDSRYCLVCDQYYCYENLENNTCYDKHKEIERMCQICKIPNTILYNEDGVEVKMVCFRCYNGENNEELESLKKWAQEPIVCEWPSIWFRLPPPPSPPESPNEKED